MVSPISPLSHKIRSGVLFLSLKASKKYLDVSWKDYARFEEFIFQLQVRIFKHDELHHTQSAAVS